MTGSMKQLLSNGAAGYLRRRVDGGASPSRDAQTAVSKIAMSMDSLCNAIQTSAQTKAMQSVNRSLAWADQSKRNVL